MKLMRRGGGPGSDQWLESKQLGTRDFGLGRVVSPKDQRIQGPQG